MNIETPQNSPGNNIIYEISNTEPFKSTVLKLLSEIKAPETELPIIQEKIRKFVEKDLENRIGIDVRRIVANKEKEKLPVAA